MSAKLGILDQSTQSMLCPCCGVSIFRTVSECGCGARFVGEPLDETPIKVQRLGPAMTSIALLALVVASALVITKWMALAAVLVAWTAWRAVRLARVNAEWYGGYKTAVTTLSLTLAAGLTLATYGIVHIPTALENYRLRQVAATQSSMYHVANLLEAYKLHISNGAYPNLQEFKQVMGGSPPTDYWDGSIKYQPIYDPVADTSIGITPISYTNFELRSAGPDGIVGNDDDIIMRDGVFFTNSEIKKQTVVQQLR